ncbi:hypothetical protein AB1O90_02685 [Pediococcus pentosaceus]|uniref:hypothetical protein n=1 Tax=Pediococcus pentosaceus TaxID=1255 RepID=UPI003461F0AA
MKKKYVGLLIVFFLLFIIGIPMIINLLLNFCSANLFDSADNDAWLGFWGGYLGAIIAIPLSFISAYVAFHLESKKRYDDWKIKVFDNLNEATIKYNLIIQSDATRYKKYMEENKTKMLTAVVLKFIGSCEVVVNTEYVNYLKVVHTQIAKLPKRDQDFLEKQIKILEELLQIDTMEKILEFQKNFKSNEVEKSVPENTVNELLIILENLVRATDILDEIENLTDKKRSIYLKE